MQQVLKGNGSLLQLTGLLQQQGIKDVLFVTGKHLLQDSHFKQLREKLPQTSRLVHPPEGVLQVEAIPACGTPDAVVAIGGGKVMDFAKGILYRHSLSAYFAAAPTTAGSGSEATPIAVFYNGKEKVSLDAPSLLPQVAILDAALLQQLPAYQKAVSGADALAQCIESVWNRHSTPLSEDYALTGLALLWQHLLLFVQTNEAASEMLWAAHLGGKAIALTRTTGPHALSYYLTAHHHVPHGQAVALTLPLFFLYNETGNNKGQLQKIFSVLQVQTAEEAFALCRQKLKEAGLATTLNELGLQQIDLDEWLCSVNQQRFANNPAPFDHKKLKALFQRYFY